MLLLLLPVLALSLPQAATAPLTAADAPPAQRTTDAAPEDKDCGPEQMAPDDVHETDSGVSVRVLSGRTWLDTDSAPLLGVGVALEHEFFDDQLIVELAVEYLHDPDRNAALFELIGEHNFAITEHTEVVLGAGPVFAAALEATPAWGGVCVLALETELAPRLQLFVELDAAVLFDPELVLETDLGTGVMWSF